MGHRATLRARCRRHGCTHQGETLAVRMAKDEQGLATEEHDRPLPAKANVGATCFKPHPMQTRREKMTTEQQFRQNLQSIINALNTKDWTTLGKVVDETFDADYVWHLPSVQDTFAAARPGSSSCATLWKPHPTIRRRSRMFSSWGTRPPPDSLHNIATRRREGPADDGTHD